MGPLKKSSLFCFSNQSVFIGFLGVFLSMPVFSFVDIDLDGLDDVYETTSQDGLAIGLSASTADSDQDGIYDSVDSDNDGLPDGWEALRYYHDEKKDSNGVPVSNYYDYANAPVFDDWGKPYCYEMDGDLKEVSGTPVRGSNGRCDAIYPYEGRILSFSTVIDSGNSRSALEIVEWSNNSSACKLPIAIYTPQNWDGKKAHVYWNSGGFQSGGVGFPASLKKEPFADAEEVENSDPLVYSSFMDLTNERYWLDHGYAVIRTAHLSIGAGNGTPSQCYIGASGVNWEDIIYQAQEAFYHIVLALPELQELYGIDPDNSQYPEIVLFGNSSSAFMASIVATRGLDEVYQQFPAGIVSEFDWSIDWLAPETNPKSTRGKQVITKLIPFAAPLDFKLVRDHLNLLITQQKSILFDNRFLTSQNHFSNYPLPKPSANNTNFAGNDPTPIGGADIPIETQEPSTGDEEQKGYAMPRVDQLVTGEDVFDKCQPSPGKDPNNEKDCIWELDETHPMLQQFSLTGWYDKYSPDVMLIHGSADDLVPPEQSINLCRAIANMEADPADQKIEHFGYTSFDGSPYEMFACNKSKSSRLHIVRSTAHGPSVDPARDSSKVHNLRNYDKLVGSFLQDWLFDDVDRDGVRNDIENHFSRSPIEADSLVDTGYNLGGCARTTDTQEGVQCWGETGDASYDLSAFEGHIPSPINKLQQLAIGLRHGCLLNDNVVSCWGENSAGQTNVPTEVGTVGNAAGNKVLQLSAYSYHNCALYRNNVGVRQVTCWGRNNASQVSGIPSLTNPSYVSVGHDHSCAVDDVGVHCWGDNSSGQSSISSASALTKPTLVDAGRSSTCAIHNGGEVACWGLDNSGQSNAPSTIKNAVALAVSQTFSCALDWVPTFGDSTESKKTEVVCWGDSTLANGHQTLSPALDNPVVIKAGFQHACALDKHGVRCWGNSANNRTDVSALSYDFDGDGVANDLDSDNDGVNDSSDAFPLDPFETVDYDGDGVGDNYDPDDDGDGWVDEAESSCGTDAKDNTSVPADADGDFLCNGLASGGYGKDLDNDGDGFSNAVDDFGLDDTLPKFIGELVAEAKGNNCYESNPSTCVDANFGSVVLGEFNFNGDSKMNAAASAPGFDTVCIVDDSALLACPTSSSGSGNAYGAALATGDFDQDGYDDLVIGAPAYNNEQGQIELVYGNASSSVSSPGTVTGGSAGDEFGAALAVLDINQDGYDDIAVGVPGDSSCGSNSSAGAVLVYSGKDLPTTAVVLKTLCASSPAVNGRFGEKLANIGDVDFDGVDDLGVSSPSFNSNDGYIWVYSGKTSNTLFEYAGNAGEGGRLGASISGGDINYDGYADILAGGDKMDVQGQVEAGVVYAFYGLGGFDDIFWANPSPLAGADFGAASAVVGDVDGDGYSDMVLGEPDYVIDNTAAQQSDADTGGKVTVISGYHGGVIATFSGSDEGDELGYSVSALGDIDGDGNADILVGAPGVDRSTNTRDAGQLLIYKLVQDADGDGMPDHWETSYSLNKLSAVNDGVNGPADDSDSDGINNLNEYLNGTNPSNADTDGDGYCDGDGTGCGSLQLNDVAPLNCSNPDPNGCL